MLGRQVGLVNQAIEEQLLLHLASQRRIISVSLSTIKLAVKANPAVTTAADRQSTLYFTSPAVKAIVILSSSRQCLIKNHSRPQMPISLSIMLAVEVGMILLSTSWENQIMEWHCETHTNICPLNC